MVETFNLELPVQQWLDEDDWLHEEPLRERIHEAVKNRYAQQEAAAGGEPMRNIEKSIMLQVLDHLWKEHLAAMDYLRQGIHLRSYAQKKPEQEYKRESFELFTQLLGKIKHEVITLLMRLHIPTPEELAAMEATQRRQTPMEFRHADADALPATDNLDGEHTKPPKKPSETFVRDVPKVGRNDPCPCGSGKKYKQCHGKLG